MIKLAFWGSELAEAGDCSFCHGPATEEDGTAFMLPIKFPFTSPLVFDRASPVFAVACKDCAERLIHSDEYLASCGHLASHGDNFCGRCGQKLLPGGSPS